LGVPQNASDGFPVYSPHGQWIAFMRLRSERDVFIMPARGGPTQQLTFDAKPKLGLTWTADSREIVYSTQRDNLPLRMRSIGPVFSKSTYKPIHELDPVFHLVKQAN
jgi:Tol biopolymer transport system component